MCISKILSYFAGETKKENVNLVIDIGNTVAKLAVFDGDKVVEVLRGSNHSLDWLSMLCNKYPIERGIIASVITLSNTIRRQLAGVPFEIIELNHLTPIPIRNLYKTPETLGMDRLAAVVGANYLSPGRNLLVVDAGTALTYEFIDAEGNYWGGNISPGIYTRFKTLNACCDKLPLIERKGETPEFGFDTETAIRAGVIRGIEFEIIGYITLLQKKYPHAEIAFSCPRLRPIINNDKIKPMDVHERQLLQVVCAYRLFMPFASITVSSRECARVRDNLMLIAANKISAGVNTGIGAHSKKQELGDEQFEIDDSRSLQEIYDALLKIGLQPVMSEYVYV